MAYEQEQEELKQNVLRRLSKIAGQVRGIQSMVESGKECQDILAQVKAVKSAINSMNSIILKRYILTCLPEGLAFPADGVHDGAPHDGAPHDGVLDAEAREAQLSSFSQLVKILTLYVE